MRKIITFVIYDGVTNSVFSSQVLQPLLNLLKENNNLEITLVSFEKEKPSTKTLINLIPAHEKLHFVLCRKLPFFGTLSLRFATYQLKKLLKIMPTDQIIARGPLAGWITIKAIKKLKNNPSPIWVTKFWRSRWLRIINKPTLQIQARGLCAQEYRFAHQYLKENFAKKLLRKFIFNELNKIELKTYKASTLQNSTIESVSSALKQYLVTNFGANPSKIKIATKDIPQKITRKEKEILRKKIRNKLGISQDSNVYCYSGSSKPWQCLPTTLDYFLSEYKKNPKSFLLILSLDKKNIEKLIEAKKIPPKNYALLAVSPEELSAYLAASDIGFLFRDKDIINWVSRPTKMLEYQAAGLKVIHNNTVAWLESENKNL